MPAPIHRITVTAGDSAYDVVVGAGVLAGVGEALRLLAPADKALVLSDSNVVDTPARATLLHALQQAGYQPVLAVLPAGETNKTFAALEPIYGKFLSAGIDRHTPLIALGGGVVGDMAGFVAATLLRGVPFVQAPTSLLAMVDASVGGKTGVNHAVGKNLIGAFHQPRLVTADCLALASLPRVELVGGLAECIKHDVIRDADGFSRLEAQLEQVLRGDVSTLVELVAHNVAIKAGVVAADPLERGERAHLNLGHTFGHAIEQVSDYSISHGQAVALGMCAACATAVELGMIGADVRDRVVALIARAGLPTRGLTLDTDRVVTAMSFDKKVRMGRVRLVLPQRLGSVVVRDDVERDVLVRAVQSLR